MKLSEYLEHYDDLSYSDFYEEVRKDVGSWVLRFNNMDDFCTAGKKAEDLYNDGKLHGVLGFASPVDVTSKSTSQRKSILRLIFWCADPNKEQILKIGRNIITQMNYKFKKHIWFVPDCKPCKTNPNPIHTQYTLKTKNL